MLPVKYGVHHPQQQQQLMEDPNGSSASPYSSVFSPANPHQQSFFLNYSQQQKQNPYLFQPHSPVSMNQLFQHHHHNQFQPFQTRVVEPVHHHVPQQQQQQQQQQPFLSFDFKLGLNENTVKKDSTLVLNHQPNDASFLHGNEQQQLPENRQPQQQQHSFFMSNSWHPQEDSPVKEHFWSHLSSCEDRQCNEDGDRETEANKYSKVLQQPDQCTTERSKSLDNKYRNFSELEAIYGLAKYLEPVQAGSGSALTGENSPSNAVLSMALTEFQGNEVGANCGGANIATGVDHGSETSIGEEASTRKAEKKKRKRKTEQQIHWMVGCFESLVKQVTDHQESLHKRFLEVIERLDRERTVKEESWRRLEAEKRSREASARANEQALASSREARIISYLEQIKGQSINLPPRNPLLLQQESAIVPFNNEPTPVKVDNNSRWPRAEVEALIQVRCNLESRFQEPGLKGPLWEEVSSFMGSLGYQRSAKRCKEKWENINKYFRKSKENGKKRSKQSKTCSYFDQLDQYQLYSRFPISSPSSPKPLTSNDIEMQQRVGSDILEAYIPEREPGIVQVNSDGRFEISELNSKLGFDGTLVEDVAIPGSHEDFDDKDRNMED